VDDAAAATVIASSTAGQDETFMWPTAERERKFKLKPIYLVIPAVVIAAIILAVVLLSGGKSKSASTQTTSTQAAPPPPPPAATPQPPPPPELKVSSATISARGNTVLTKLQIGGVKLKASDVFVKDARALDGKTEVWLKHKLTKGDSLGRKTGKGLTVAICCGGKPRAVVSVSSAKNKFTVMKAKVTPNGHGIVLTYTVKPKPPPPPVVNPPPAVVNPPPAVVNPPPAVVNPPPPVVNPPPPVVNPPPPPPVVKKPPPPPTFVGG
jgi:hypothetical protein